MELSLSETDIEKVGLTGAREGYQDSVLDMLNLRCLLDIHIRRLNVQIWSSEEMSGLKI